MSQTHKQRTMAGLGWNFKRVILQTVSSFVVVVLLARILPPAEFGLITFSMIFLGLAEMFASFGVDAAVVQKKDLTQQDRNTAWTLSTAAGLIAALLLYLSSGFIAQFFRLAELEDMLSLMGLHFMLFGCGAVIRGQMLRRLDFYDLFWIDSSAHLIGYCGVTIYMALNGYGAWSFVLGTLSSTAISTIILLFKRDGLTLGFHYDSARWLLRYGGGYTLAGVTPFAAMNVDYIFIGRYLGQEALGYYNRAYHLVTVPLAKIVGTLVPVMFSSYSQIQDDRGRVWQIYQRKISVITLIMFPFFTLASINADFVVIGLYGDNWWGAVPVFKILTVTALLRLVTILTGPVLKALGYVYLEAIIQISYLSLLVVSCYLASQYSMEMVALAAMGCAFFHYIAINLAVSSVLQKPFFSILAAQWQSYLTLLLIVTGGYLLSVGFALFLDHDFFSLLVVFGLNGLFGALCFLALPARFSGNLRVWILNAFLGKVGEKLPAKINNYLKARCLSLSYK